MVSAFYFFSYVDAECHCPGSVTFTPAVKAAWFKYKHNQSVDYNVIARELTQLW